MPVLNRPSKENSQGADLIVFSSPHLHGGETAAGYHWKKTTALLPLFAVVLWFSGLNALGIVTASLVGGLAGEALSEFLQKKRLKLLDGSSVFNSLLFAFVLPADVPYGMAAFGSFFAILVGREIFGGLGQSLFQPALVGLLFLEICFPAVFAHQPGIVKDGWLSTIALFAGALFLFWRRLVFWEIPMIYLGALFIFSLPFDRELWPLFLSPLIFFGAVFFVADPVMLPPSNPARNLFAILAALMIFLLEKTGISAAWIYGLLIANALSPWLERAASPGRI